MWTLKQTVDYALSQIGETDGGKYFKIAFGYRSMADWCAAFDSALKVLGGLDCPYFANTFAFDKRDLKIIGNRWVEPYDLQVGDFISFDFDGGGQYGGDHVGYVVERVAAGDYWTVEGNCGKRVQKKHRTVANTKTYYANGSLKGIGIIGGIRPKYKAGKEEKVRDFATLKRGSNNKTVKVLQALLNLLFNAGLEVDGYFGALTGAAVRSAQKKLGIVVDEVVGPITWGKLLLG